MEAFIKQLNIVFSLKNLGHLHYFLGIEVQRDASGMYLKQSKYIGDLLRKFKMEIVYILEKQFLGPSGKQKVVSRSSPESEYRALADLPTEVAWISTSTRVKATLAKETKFGM